MTMKTHAKGYLFKNILGVIFAVSGILILVSQLAGKVSAMTQVDPTDPKISSNNSLIISKHPPKSPVHIDIDGPTPIGRKRAPEGEGNNDGKGWKLEDLNNILTVANGGYRDFQAEYGAETIVWPAHTLKDVNKVTATYGIVGTYKGKDVTAKIELSNFQDIPATNSNKVDWLIFSDSLWSGLCYYGVESFTQTYHFFYTDGSPVHFDNTDSSHTYLTYNSMNGAMNQPGKDSKFSEWVSGQNAKNSYVTTSTIEEEGQFGSGFSAIGGMQHWNHKYDNMGHPFSEDGFEDKLGAPTYTDASSVWEVDSDAPAFIVGSERNHQGFMTWLSFSSATIWNNRPEKPIKDVVEDGKSINNKLVVPHEKFEYTITQKVGIMGQDMLTKYRQFDINDKLPNEVTYLDTAYITDDATGKRLDANAGAFTYENGILTYKFSYNYLKNIMAYEGETYTVHIPV
ncbi:isopeptide-forming domain-containing fimbrial protein, partial [Lactobacillus sp. XV13L]|nr:isopeptide-forming domain-containing fimbrial protein [Lactobacillus sp. XV13L]